MFLSTQRALVAMLTSMMEKGVTSDEYPSRSTGDVKSLCRGCTAVNQRRDTAEHHGVALHHANPLPFQCAGGNHACPTTPITAQFGRTDCTSADNEQDFMVTGQAA